MRTQKKSVRKKAAAYKHVDRVEVFLWGQLMGRNCDDHTKNFSFLLRQGAAWELSPAYGITFAHNPDGEWTNQHLMSVNGKFKGFTEGDLLAVAKRFAIGSAPRIIEQVREAVKAWPDFAAHAGVSAQQAEHIGKQHLLMQ